MKPSSKMAEFKEYLRNRRREPFDLKTEHQPTEQKARGKRNVSEDEEWIVICSTRYRGGFPGNPKVLHRYQ